MNHAEGHANTYCIHTHTHTQIERYDICAHHNLCSWRTLFCDENYDKTKHWIQTHTDTLGPAALRSIPVSDSPHASLACSVWANQQMAHCFLFFFLQHELKEEQGRNKWLKRGEKNAECVRGGERSDHLLQWREFVNCTSNRRAVSHQMDQ